MPGLDRRLLLIFCLAPAFLLLGACDGPRGETSRSGRLPEGIGRLILDHGACPVVISSGDGEWSWRVTASGDSEAQASELAAASMLVADGQDGFRMTLALDDARFEEGELRITVPRGVNLVLSGSGDQRVKGLEGRIDAYPKDGSLQLEDHHGEVVIRPSSAVVEVVGVRGRVEVREDTDSGSNSKNSLRIDDVQEGAVEVHYESSSFANVRVQSVQQVGISVRHGSVRLDNFAVADVKCESGPVSVGAGISKLSVYTGTGDQAIKSNAVEIECSSRSGEIELDVGSACRVLRAKAQDNDISYRMKSRDGYLEMFAKRLTLKGTRRSDDGWYRVGSCGNQDRYHAVLEAPKGRIRFP